jgi:serine/threonine protein kinase
MTDESPSPSEVQLSRLESVIQRLEEIWRAGVVPDLEDLLTDVPAHDRDRIAVECVKVDMECRWRSGRSVHIENYLPRFPDLLDDLSVAVELLESECYSRILYASPPAMEELESRFPQMAPQIDLVAITDEALLDREDLQVDASTQTPRDDATGTSPDAPPLILLGERLGRYQIASKIGTGGQGDVYRARDTQLGRDVALKLLRHSDADLLDRFAREGSFGASVEHPNICHIFDAGTISGIHFIAMALIDGQTIQQRLNEDGPFEPHDAAQLVRDIATALSHVHAAGIVHRDIKSGNIMIDRSGVPILMDFGLARSASHSQGMTTTDDFGGTLAFMSPEQASGYAPDHRSDIYSVGVVLYQMLTGEVPFSLLPAEFFKQIGKSSPNPRKIRPELDPDLDTICRVAMAPQPADRYQSADEMSDALARYLKGRPQVIQPAPSRRLRSSLLATTCMALIAVACWAAWNSRPSEPKMSSQSARPDPVRENQPQLPDATVAQQLGPRQVDRWIETGFFRVVLCC